MCTPRFCVPSFEVMSAPVTATAVTEPGVIETSWEKLPPGTDTVAVVAVLPLRSM